MKMSYLMFQCYRSILSITFYNGLICIVAYPGTKQHRFILSLTFLLVEILLKASQFHNVVKILLFPVFSFDFFGRNFFG